MLLQSQYLLHDMILLAELPQIFPKRYIIKNSNVCVLRPALGPQTWNFVEVVIWKLTKVWVVPCCPRLM